MTQPVEYWKLSLSLMQESNDAFWTMFCAGSVGVSHESRLEYWSSMHRKLARMAHNERR